MEFSPYIVYVKINDAKCITEINSSAFLTSTDGWIEIDSGYGDKYHHSQGNYFDKPIMDDRGIYRYALDKNNKPYERTQAEMDADYIEPIVTPSQLDIIEAQVTYTAMMTDTLLEG